jgi:hypothetical protein
MLFGAMARRRREPGQLRSVCLDAFLVFWVGGMVLRASTVVLAPLVRWFEPLALVLTTAFRR